MTKGSQIRWEIRSDLTQGQKMAAHYHGRDWAGGGGSDGSAGVAGAVAETVTVRGAAVDAADSAGGPQLPLA